MDDITVTTRKELLAEITKAEEHAVICFVAGNEFPLRTSERAAFSEDLRGGFPSKNLTIAYIAYRRQIRVTVD